ncbi:TIGR04053 family radical SAM/SPASM domain-containing protein [soil metagenome]
MKTCDPYSASQLFRSPRTVYWEVTRACDMACQHCRAGAQPDRHERELSQAQGEMLIDELLSFPRSPLLVLTGGDPMKRDDLPELIGFASRRGMEVALTLAATPLVTKRALIAMQQQGLKRLTIALDGIDAATHDGMRGEQGSYARTMENLRFAKEIGLPMQVSTLISRRNVLQVDGIASLLEPLGVTEWSVHLLVPLGRGRSEQRIDPFEVEHLFAELFAQSRKRSFRVKTADAPQYRRYLHQNGQVQANKVSMNDGKGVMFVSHTGDIYPGALLPVWSGRFPIDSPVTVYQRSPVFTALRDPSKLKGKCGVCEFRSVCGGSRARAYAVTRDMLAPEPDCSYQPSSAVKALVS